MAKKVQLQSNPKKWEVVDGVEVLVDQEIHDLDPMTDSSCVKIEGHRTLEETLSQNNMFTPEITETKVMTEVGGTYHDSVVDGAYEQAILYGNTQVNLSEAVTEGSKYIPLPFTSFQGNEKKVDTQKSNYMCQVAPLIKGVTMVNLAQETSLSVVSGSGVWVNNVKPSTKYTLILTYTIQNSQKGLIIQSYNDTTYLENSKQITSLETNVQLTFTTHENANAIRICNPEGYGGETIQLDDIMVLEGDMTDLDIPFFKGMRSVELVRPLTNLFSDDLVHYNQNTSSTNTDGDITVTSTSVSSWNNTDYYLKNLKPHTKYIVMWDSLTTTQTSTTQQEILVCVVSVQYNVKLGGINEDEKCPTLRSIIFDTRDKDLSQIVFRIHATMSNSETGITTVKGLRIFEWDDSLRTLDLQGIGYFSGTKNVCQHVFKTESKNLYPYGDINFTNDYVGWCDAKGKTNMYGDIAQKSSTRFLLKKGTYTFSIGSAKNAELTHLIDDKEQLVGHLGHELKTFTLTQDTYCTIRVKTKEANVATTVTNIQIERGETATTYSAYHGRAFIANGNDEIILRSLPNGVCDTYNLQTGELVQNSWYATYNGDSSKYTEFSIDNSVSTATNYVVNNTSAYFKLNQSVVGYGKILGYEEMPNMICDKLKVCSRYDCQQTTQNSICVYNEGEIGVRIDGVKTVEQLATYLNQNPITFQFEMRNPIIKTITTYDRTYVPYSTNKSSIGNNLGSFTYDTKDHMMIVGNLSPVPPIVESITELPYKMRLKPNTTYTVKCLRGNSQTMSFDLGGTVYNDTTPVTSNSGLPYEVLIKTPVSQLSHDYLKISGTGFAQKIVVVEGDIRGTELPYFDGMCNAKMPIVKNVGKNLFNPNIIGDSGQYIRNDSGVLTSDTTSKFSVGYISVKPSTKYYLYIKGLQRVYFLDNKKQWISRTGILYNQGTETHVINTNFTTQSNCHYIQIQYRVDELDLTNATLVEYGDSNPHVEHKENSIYITQGEYPITSEMMEQGGFGFVLGDNYQGMKNDNTARLRSKDLIPVKPNTTYAFAHSFSKFAYNVYQWNGNKEFIDGTSQYFASGQIETITTTADTQYIHFLMSKHDASQAITVAEYDWSQFHMYELDSTINLRSLPNGVKDELNLLTGEYIQRVGEVVFDGSDDEDWQLYNESIGGSKYFRIGMSVMKLHGDVYTLCTHAICDKLENVVYFSGIYNMSSRPDSVVAFVHSSTLNTQAMFVYQAGNQGDLVQFKQWLQQSPITVQYELAEPITSHVRLVSNNQEREVGVKLPNGVCNTYNPSTGITTVRVGFIEFDGSEDWYGGLESGELQQGTIASSVYGAWTKEPLPNARPASVEEFKIPGVCDTFSFKNATLDSTNKEFYFISTSGRFNMNIARTKLTGSNASHLKEYLSQNPIKLWYELKYPQIQPDIVLPNGVHDEYNPVTGVYTKRVGYVELHGSVDEKLDSIINNFNKENTIVFFAYGHTPLAKKYEDKGKGYPIYTNQFEYVDVDLGQSSGGGIGVDIEGAYMAFDGNPCFSISKEKLEPFGFTNDMNTKTQVLPIISKYLSQNPIKVWYELATPVTYQLTPYSALPTPYAYEDGYIIMESAYSETTLPPEFNYKLLANRIGQVMQNNRKLQEHTTRLSNLEVIIIEATIESLFNREMQRFELELMDIQLVSLD